MKQKIQPPKSILDKMDELNAIVEKYPISIPLPVVADFLGVKDEGLRAGIYNGTCPFGIAWKLGNNRAFKIPTTKFYLWMTNNALF